MRFKKFISLILIFTIIANLCIFNIAAQAESARRYFVSADFEGETLPEDLTYNNGSGSITIKEAGGRRAMYMDNGVDGSFTLVTKSFPAVTSDELVTEVSFMQPDAKSNGNIILELLSSTDSVFSVVTDSGNISAVKADGSKEVIVPGYSVNTWYDIKVVANLNSKKCDFYINNTLVVGNIDFRTNVSSVDTISSYARFVPGFYLDDFKVSQEADFGNITVTGATLVENPAPGEAEYTFSGAVPFAGITEYSFGAVLTSSNGLVLQGEELVWTLSGDNTAGITVSPSQDKSSAKIKISPQAAVGGFVTLTVATLGNTISKKIKISLEQAENNNIKITGDPRVSAYGGKAATFNYVAKLYDQFGGEIPNQTFKWEIDNQSCADISISQTGVLTVSGAMPEKDEKVIIRVKLVNDETVFREKSVLVQSYDTYYNDKQRLELAIKGVDSIIKASSNPDGRNPLMGFYISPYENTYGFWNLQGTGPTPCSNLTEQFELMRAMEGITGLTGDENYHQRVMDIYQWYLDHGLSQNGLVYWGNHQTMDLETGEWAEYFEKYATAQNYVEVKDRDLYLLPYFQLDNEAASKICIDHWSAIIKDWTTMTFNRHAIIKQSDPDYSGFNNLDLFLEKPNASDSSRPDDPWVRSKDLCFMSSAAALVAMADFNYQYSENRADAEQLVRWAHNLVYRYINTRNPETKMFGTLFTSSKRLEGIYSLAEVLGREDWWNHPSVQGRTGNPTGDLTYGDRFYNQFAHALVSGGYMTWEEAEEEAWEGALINSNYTTCSAIFNDVMHLGRTMMASDNPEFQAMGRQMIYDYFIGVHAYVDVAYDFDQNYFHKVLTNGIILDDVYWTVGGYWGSAGKTFGNEKPSDFHADNFIQAYMMTSDFPELEAERELLWEAARNICDKTYHMGDIGNPLKNEKPNLNLAINSTNTTIIRMLLNLYEASGWEEYLTQARIIGNNIISNVFKEGYFIPNSSLQYINTDGEYPYVLLKLEAVLRGEPDLVPDSRYLSHHECDATWIDERGALMSWDSAPHKSLTYPSVLVKDIRISDYDIEIKVGESAGVGITIIPDDATSKAIYWDIRDRDILGVDANNSFIGLKEGETVAYAVSRSTANMISKPVHIKVTR